MGLKRELAKLIVDWKLDHRPKEFPLFDRHVSDSPHTLVFMQDLGPSDEVPEWFSIQNEEESALELKRLALTVYRQAELQHMLLWSPCPWECGAGEMAPGELELAKKLHSELIKLLQPSLRRVLLMGSEAHQLLPFLSGLEPTIQILGGHHTGQLARMNPTTVIENEALFLTLGRLQ